MRSVIEDSIQHFIRALGNYIIGVISEFNIEYYGMLVLLGLWCKIRGGF